MQLWATNRGGYSVDLTNDSNWGGVDGTTFDGYGTCGDPQFTASTLRLARGLVWLRP